MIYQSLEVTNNLKQQVASYPQYENGLILSYIDGLVQDCSNFIANALELLEPCT